MALANNPDLVRGVSDKHRLLMRLLIGGLSKIEAGKLSGFTAMRVSYLLQKPTFSDELERLRKEVTGSFVEKASDVGATITGYLEDEGLASAKAVVALRDSSQDEKIRLAASKDVLDRIGLRGKETLDVNERVVGSDSLIKMLEVAAAEMKKKNAGS